MEDSTSGWRSHHHQKSAGPPLLTRRHVLFAGAAALGTFGVWSRSSTSSSTDGAPETSTTNSTAILPVQQTVAETVAPETTTTIAPLLDRTLVEGTTGADVQAMQTRLVEVGFDHGPIDGIFGGSTLRSVWAYEKLVLGTSREEMSGAVTQDVWERMNQPTGVHPRRSPGGTHMEVYLPQQVAVLFENGAIRLISHVSSGDGETWCDEVLIDLDDGTQETKGICGISITPGGVYHFERKIDGWRNGKLGRLYKPVYFNYGIAIHGAGNVPAYPASHGCVRFPMHIAEYIQDLVSIGDAIYVFDGVEEPETYGAQPMIFDYPDPDWIPPTTTTTTTTTVPASTTTTSTPPPATTAPTTLPTTAPPTTLPRSGR